MKNKYLLRDFLDAYPIQVNRCMELAQVNRTTFKRWMNGTSNPPLATIELFRMHARKEPPSGMSHEWLGWTFTQGKLWTPANRGFEPFEIAQIPDFYRDRAILQNIHKNFTLQANFNY